MSLLTGLEHSLIAGDEYQGKKRFSVLNPANAEQIAYVSQVDEQGVKLALNSALTTFDALKQTSAAQRSEVLQRWFELVIEHKAVLARLLTQEQGKPLKEAMGEVDYAAGFIQWYGEQAKRNYGEIIPANDQQHQLRIVKQGVGVVLGITPWNFPLAMITRKVAPAYAAGCSFILKPSEQTPLSAIALAKLALEAGMQKGAFQVLLTSDSAALIKPLCENPDIRKLTFTGSTKVGATLLSQCAGTIKRTSMELGGNAPFIFFESANIDNAITGLMAAKFRNAGQTCVAANRILIQQSIEQTVLAHLVEAVAQLVVGDGLSEGVDIGPLITVEAKQKAQKLVAEAVEQGAKIVYQGEELDGSFMAPMILTGVTPQMQIAQQEIFAPVVSVMSFSDESQALHIANDVKEGLAAYFYSQDVSQIHRVSMSLEYGMVGINEGMVSNPVAPFGGVKQSGLGREGAHQGLDEYLDIKYLCQKFD
ncbi:NAD-dependent succinate-semialdehyde dehydrogenase [Pseudoalteromonas sp. JBTF-M23]|uniref:NAD-dependent succinate-semialdehyde dehydrogenase n=1 Tax=Pseudoalteromonas caenipelagi TaxID=2726988 RepID=A0A849VFE3_9GAMM|nr:NAD-dependent succinate-semialdehyde dehydrogenase [Pseudoalteromonas caenipelagi]NOU51986.1 NAD-dependent succinate-semialdehyde dehydrogenase [Pseudoalteromonas caenipelagi]